MKNLWLLSCVILFWSFNAGASFSQSLWELANENKDVLRDLHSFHGRGCT